jgi:hypothetical protein
LVKADAPFLFSYICIMAEAFKANLTAGVSIPITNAELFLEEVFAVEGNHAMMCRMLERYHWGMGTSPQVDDFCIELVKPDAGGSSGSFRCRYRVGYSFTCSGIESGENSTIAWQYTIDIEGNTVHFKGEEPLTRDGDEF